MNKRLTLTIASCVSLAVLVALCATIPLECKWGGYGPTGWVLWGDTRIGAFHHGLSIYNNLCPYSGSIVKVAGNEWPHVSGFDGPGLYYRRIEQRSGETWWTLTVSRAYPFGMAAIFPVIWLVRRLCRPCRDGKGAG